MPSSSSPSIPVASPIQRRRRLLALVRRTSGFTIGLILLLLVVFIWVGSSELIQFIFKNQTFSKPFFLTYYSTSLFSVYLLGFAFSPSWRQLVRDAIRINKAPTTATTNGVIVEGKANIINNNNNNDVDIIYSQHDDDDDDYNETRILTPRSQKNQKKQYTDSADGNADAASFNYQQQQQPIHCEDKNKDKSKNNINNVEGNSVVVVDDYNYDYDYDHDESRVALVPSSAVAAHTSSSSSVVEVERLPLKQVLITSAILYPLWFVENLIFNYSLDMTSVASNTILSTTSSLFTFVLALVFLRDDPNERAFSIMRLVSVIATLLGVSLIAWSDKNNSGGGGGHDSLLGDILSLVSAFMYAGYTTILKKRLPDERAVSMPMVFAFIGLFTLVTVWPFFFVVNYINEPFEWPSWTVFGYLSINGLVGTVLSDCIWAQSVLLTSPVVSTIGLSLTIPLAIVADFLVKFVSEIKSTPFRKILAASFKWQYLLGSAVVLIGFTVANVSYLIKDERVLRYDRPFSKGNNNRTTLSDLLLWFRRQRSPSSPATPTTTPTTTTTAPISSSDTSI